jgi:hypothetical protein
MGMREGRVKVDVIEHLKFIYNIGNKKAEYQPKNGSCDEWCHFCIFILKTSGLP